MWTKKETIILASIVIVLLSIFVPLCWFMTSPYVVVTDSNISSVQITRLYQYQGDSPKVWVASVKTISDSQYVLEVHARSIGGKNDIANFLSLLQISYNYVHKLEK